MDYGSFFPPSCCEAIVQIGIAMQQIVTHNCNSRKKGICTNESAAIIGNAAADPHVPGAGRTLPIQKHVANTTAGCLQAADLVASDGSVFTGWFLLAG
tara:strand:+ start:3067 stop:3360 length:294 start_codon:yes stop_codon:yes gene_type:complete